MDQNKLEALVLKYIRSAKKYEHRAKTRPNQRVHLLKGRMPRSMLMLLVNRVTAPELTGALGALHDKGWIQSEITMTGQVFYPVSGSKGP